ncbi:MAG: tetratricopeptide repeat protein [Janthinobacterium lividum]
MPALFQPGDVFYTHADSAYHVFKVLAVDERLGCYHVRCYVPVATVPSAQEVAGLAVAVGHSPISADGFGEPVLLTHQPVAAHELEGYHYYLNAMQGDGEEPVNPAVDQAIEYFNQALALSDEERHLEAIAAYTEAFKLVPVFYEALDNRAFCKMDLGQWQAAILDFEESLQINSLNALAEFSIGECYFNLGDDDQATRRFEKALEIDPAYNLPREFLQKVAARH